MSTFLLLALLLSMTNYSCGSYCVCNQGVSDTLLQENIDYACGKADCSAIQKTGSCYLPNTVKAHCDYAVNIYYQKMNQVTGSCNFSGTATITSALSSTLGSGCTYPASPSEVTSSTPTGTSPTPTGTSSTPTSTSSTPTTPTTAITPSTSTTIPSTSSTGSTAFDSGPSGSFSKGSTIDPNSMSLALITLFLSGLLALWS